MANIAVSGWGLTVLRVVIGIVFLAHGVEKFFISGVGGVTGFFTQLGIPLPGLSAFVVSFFELVAGAALIIGFYTRLAAIPLAIISNDFSVHEEIVDMFRNFETYQTDQPKPTDHQNPQFLLEEKEYLAKYQNALANISEAQRVAFLMNRIEGKKHQEIADILGISRKAVEKRIYNALENLRKHIEDIP